MDLLDRAEVRRTDSLANLNAADQAELGQFFTPHQAARIIADLPRIPTADHIRVLDPGAGSGILTAAMVSRLRAARPDVAIHVTAAELDPALHTALSETLDDVRALGGITTELIGEDFVTWALHTSERFDLVIQNPPYSKLSTGSRTQAELRAGGIDVPNIYAAFLALGVSLLREDGQQVAITPRSWMNGTYYSGFRRNFVRRAGIDAIHTFESRSKVFGDTGVLQEAIVVSATLGAKPSEVTVWTSHDHRTDPTSRTVRYGDVVTADFIHVPATQKDADAIAWTALHTHHTLAELGLTVSTGRVVDFRSRDMLHQEQLAGAAPMVNATHIRGGVTRHPVAAVKKPQWFHTDSVTASKLLVPGGTYVLIKRFSAKEERRRVVAAVWSSHMPAAFDNKLNYVHQAGAGLDGEVARGLSVYLNSTRLDDYFRVFSGHTQVNATDLRQMRFPSLAQLRSLAAANPTDQTTIDAAVETVLAATAAAA